MVCLIVNDDILHPPLFAEHGKTSMVWWMLVEDVSPSRRDTRQRVRTSAAVVKRQPNALVFVVFIVSLTSSLLCRCRCDVLEGVTSPRKDTSAWIATVYYEDSQSPGTEAGRLFLHCFKLEMKQKSLSTEHWKKLKKEIFLINRRRAKPF